MTLWMTQVNITMNAGCFTNFYLLIVSSEILCLSLAQVLKLFKTEENVLLLTLWIIEITTLHLAGAFATSKGGHA